MESLDLINQYIQNHNFLFYFLLFENSNHRNVIVKSSMGNINLIIYNNIFQPLANRTKAEQWLFKRILFHKSFGFYTLYRSKIFYNHDPDFNLIISLLKFY